MRLAPELCPITKLLSLNCYSIWSPRKSMANPSMRKKPAIRDEAIDVNELAGMSNMKGMLSFLDTKPEEYAKLFAHVADLPAPHNETGAPDSSHNHQKVDRLSVTDAHITGAPATGAPDIETGSSI